MKAREIHTRHFRSSVGSMLNENYGSGLTPATVKSADFAYVPPTTIPMSDSALQFLNHKFPGHRQDKPRPTSTTGSLNEAYMRAVGQPQMMVHYDRDPLYWASKRQLETTKGDKGPQPTDSFNKNILLMDNYGGEGLVPSNVSPASTPLSVSSMASSQIAKMPKINEEGDIVQPYDGISPPANTPDSEKGRGKNSALIKPLSGKLEDNRHRLWTPGSEAAGFKPYSPFSETFSEKARKEMNFNAPEIPEAVLRTSDAVEPPRYYDAFRHVMGLDPSEGQGRPGSVNVLKVHGNPEYPSKVMQEEDVPNYIAWAKIYPYCPLTQKEGEDKPVFVPPRGFTPSTASKPPSPANVVDISKLKKDIIAGVKPKSSLPRSRRGLGVVKSPEARKSPEALKSPEARTPPPPAPSLTTKLLKHKQKLQDQEQQKLRQQEAQQQRQVQIIAEILSTPQPVKLEQDVSRRILDLKMKAPDVWYTGRTPTHTPTPDYTLPIQPSKAWIKHYSPQRVRHFLNVAAADAKPAV